MDINNENSGTPMKNLLVLLFIKKKKTLTNTPHT